MNDRLDSVFYRAGVEVGVDVDLVAFLQPDLPDVPHDQVVLGQERHVHCSGQVSAGRDAI